MIVINPMSTNLSSIEALDGKIAVATYLLIAAGAATVVATAFSFYFRAEQSELLKQRRDQDAVTIEETKEKSANAIAVAEESRAKQKESELKLAEVTKENLALSIKLAETRSQLQEEGEERKDLAEAVTPRVFEQLGFHRAIQQFSSIKARIVVVDAPEPRSLAEQISTCLSGAGIEHTSSLPGPKDPQRTEVNIEYRVDEMHKNGMHTRDAAETIARYLNDGGITAYTGTSPRSREPEPNTITIRVGEKQLYFISKSIEKERNWPRDIAKIQRKIFAGQRITSKEAERLNEYVRKQMNDSKPK
jgi:hypothetical protein